MKHAINELTLALNIAKNNEPIQRASGEVEQADYNLERIGDIGKALVVLEAIEKGAVFAIDPAFEHRANMAQTTIEEKAQPEMVTEWHDDVAGVVPDDDLGELDPSKACGFGEEGCSSCQ